MKGPDTGNLVDPKDGCPRCGERDTDLLWWLDDERVQCLACKAVYTPPGPEPTPGR
jgi:hypothetical protein